MALPPLVEQLVRAPIRALSAYPVPSAAGMIKLDAMENPYTWPPEYKAQWLEHLAGIDVNRYPDPQATRLKQALRDNLGLDAGQELLLGNGSDEIIQIIALALAAPGRVVMAPEPSFVMFKMIATYVGMEYVGVPLTPDFTLDLPALLSAIATHRPALMFLAQPNNPTGIVYAREEILAIIDAMPGLVVIDEAYAAFTDADHLDLLAHADKVVIMRTLSKVGLAGLRLGLLIGASAWLSQFEKLRLPYNINVLTQASAEFALTHYALLREQTEQLRVSRAALTQALQGLPLARVWPSQANFVLVKTAAGRARAVFDALKNQGILIKCLDGSHPLLTDCLRLTVGTPEENQRLLQALKHIFFC